MKTNELTGAALDWAVAKCEGLPKAVDSSGLDGPVIVCGFEQEVLHSQHRKGQEWKAYQPSTDWRHGGPIIEQAVAKIERFSDALWEATAFTKNAQDFVQSGPTPLIAAMRCYVASKLGDEVDVPKELQP
jgi:hypothetical protein